MARALTVAQLLEAVAQRPGGAPAAQLQGGADLSIAAVAPLESAGATELAFLANPRYRAQAATSLAGALVIAPDAAQALFPQGRASGALINCSEPYAWFAMAAQVLAPAPRAPGGVHATAVVDASAQVAADACIEAQAVIGPGARIGAGAWIGPGCVIGADVHIGAGTRLHGRVQVYAGCSIGARGLVHAGAVIGADGFGFAPFRGAWVKIPQVGAVRIGDDVEIGANTTIDRGSAGDTVIGDDVKIDNQVQIGHNCRIGDHSAIAGCVGIAGSATIGRHCMLGGAAMIHGHITLADRVVVGAGTLVSRDLREPDFYTGVFPTMRNRDWERNAALVRHLTDMRERLRALERAARSDSHPPPPEGTP
jgi:UDP-3-O-[3-hydroxymyristoyl] glucosamine N-acyltransferase